MLHDTGGIVTVEHDPNLEVESSHVDSTNFCVVAFDSASWRAVAAHIMVHLSGRCARLVSRADAALLSSQTHGSIIVAALLWPCHAVFVLQGCSSMLSRPIPADSCVDWRAAE